jgi:hypothetical protein
MPAITSTGGPPSCGGGSGGLTYSSREVSMDTGFGPGWSDADELPYLTGGAQNMVARFGTEQTVWFDAQGDGSYTARYGATDTLSHDDGNDLFILTRADGTRYEFFDTEQTARPPGGLYRWVQPGGATVEVTAWTEAGIYGQITEVLDKTTPAGQATLKREFTYAATYGGREHVHTLTLSQYDDAASEWVNVRRLSYDYYGYDASYGLPGDLKTIVTGHWDAGEEDWVGDDTNYFRYYTDAAGAHGLKRVLIPNAYAAFVAAYGDPDDAYNSYAGDTQNDPIANYTCFYYEYDADRRVSNRIVFGQSNQSEFAVTLSTHSRSDYNNWIRKTVEARLDGSTHTVYVNYLGQPILSDLYDPASETHTLTYHRYDADGRRVLTAEPSAFVLYASAYYDEDLPDLIDFAGGDSPYLSDAAGLFRITAYYAATSQDIDEDTAGGVQGYLHQTAVVPRRGRRTPCARRPGRPDPAGDLYVLCPHGRRRDGLPRRRPDELCKRRRQRSGQHRIRLHVARRFVPSPGADHHPARRADGPERLGRQRHQKPGVRRARQPHLVDGRTGPGSVP